MTANFRNSQRRHQSEQESDHSLAWLLTFSDLLMLLLSLFVLRFSMSTFDTTKVFSSSPKPLANAAPPAANFAASDEKLLELGHRLNIPVKFASNGHALKAQLLGEAFQQGSDELTFQGAEALQTLATALKGSNYRVEVASHAASSLHLPETRFASAWQLAHARAIAVLRQIIDTGVEPQLISLGNFGASKLHQTGDETGPGVINLELSGEIDITIRDQ